MRVPQREREPYKESGEATIKDGSQSLEIHIRREMKSFSNKVIIRYINASQAMDHSIAWSLHCKRVMLKMNVTIICWNFQLNYQIS